MKKNIMKIAIILGVLIGSVALTGCGSDNKETKSDTEYVKAKGAIVVGITEFEPMDYKDGSGNWVGFDAEMAKAFADSLGVEVDFVEIDWDSKEMELENASIDCVWNGMTLNAAVKKAMKTSNPYCKNAQVVVVNKDVADKYADKESCKELNFAVEAGSAGADAAKEQGYKYVEVQTQAAALMEVQAGTADAAIIDLLMAGAMIGEGTSYDNLTYTVSLTSEEYGVGFRKDSDLPSKLNEFLLKSYEDGTMMEIAKKYGTQESLIEQTA